MCLMDRFLIHQHHRGHYHHIITHKHTHALHIMWNWECIIAFHRISVSVVITLPCKHACDTVLLWPHRPPPYLPKLAANSVHYNVQHAFAVSIFHYAIHMYGQSIHSGLSDTRTHWHSPLKYSTYSLYHFVFTTNNNRMHANGYVFVLHILWRSSHWESREQWIDPWNWRNFQSTRLRSQMTFQVHWLCMVLI